MSLISLVGLLGVATEVLHTQRSSTDEKSMDVICAAPLSDSHLLTDFLEFFSGERSKDVRCDKGECYTSDRCAETSYNVACL